MTLNINLQYNSLLQQRDVIGFINSLSDELVDQNRTRYYIVDRNTNDFTLNSFKNQVVRYSPTTNTLDVFLPAEGCQCSFINDEILAYNPTQGWLPYIDDSIDVTAPIEIEEYNVLPTKQRFWFGKAGTLDREAYLTSQGVELRGLFMPESWYVTRLYAFKADSAIEAVLNFQVLESFIIRRRPEPKILTNLKFEDRIGILNEPFLIPEKYYFSIQNAGDNLADVLGFMEYHVVVR